MATAYEKVQLARGKGRPSGLSFIQNIFPDFIELHGDRRFADDPAVIGMAAGYACDRHRHRKGRRHKG